MFLVLQAIQISLKAIFELELIKSSILALINSNSSDSLSKLIYTGFSPCVNEI